ncbi:MAG: condensation domain-containing protein, partial [Deltaproteobacteria bacterium]|nr:condensation domain-containing protein [Deltaproteobacteria bacterium]
MTVPPFDPLRPGMPVDPPERGAPAGSALEALLNAASAAMNVPSGSLDPELGFEEQGGDSLSAFFASQQLRAAGWILSAAELLAAMSLAEAAQDAGIYEGAGFPAEGAAPPGGAAPFPDGRPEAGGRPRAAADAESPFAAGARAHGFQAKQLEDEERVIEALDPVTPLSISPLTPAMEAACASWEARGPRFTQRLLEIGMDADPFALGNRLELLGARHEILRTALVTRDVARSRLASLPELPLPLTYTSLIGFSAADREERVREFRRAVPAPDPARDALFRVDIFQAEPSRALVLISYLEDLFDQFTVSSLAAELVAPRPPAGAPRPFSEFLALLEGRERGADAAFWEAALKGVKSVSSLFVPAAGDPDPELGEPVAFELDDQLYKRLKTLSRVSRVPVPSLVECAFAAALSMFNGEKVQLYLRRAPVREMLAGQLQNTMGCLLALAPARCELSGQKTFLECAATLERFHSEAAPHSFAPPWECRRAAGGLDFGDIVFFAEEEARFTQGSLKIREILLPRPKRSEADFVFHLEWSERQARVLLHASPDRFRRAMALDFRDGFLGAASALAASPNARLSDVNLMGKALKDRVLEAARGSGGERRGGGAPFAGAASEPEAGFPGRGGLPRNGYGSAEGEGVYEDRAGRAAGHGEGSGGRGGRSVERGAGFPERGDGFRDGGDGFAERGDGFRDGGDGFAEGGDAFAEGAGRRFEYFDGPAGGEGGERPGPDARIESDPGYLPPAPDPSAEAVEFGGRAWTREDLERAVSEGARFLSDKAAPPAPDRRAHGEGGGQPGEGMRAALLFPYGPLLAVAALSAVRAGCAVVPLDPLLPRERHRFILSDSAAEAVLSSKELLPYAEDLCKSAAADKGLSPQQRAPVWDFESLLARALGPGSPAGPPGVAPGPGREEAPSLREAAQAGTRAAASDFRPQARARAACDPDRLAAVLYCSRPAPGEPWKREELEGGGAALSAAALTERMRVSREAFGLGPGARALAVPGTPAERLFADAVPALRYGGASVGFPEAGPSPGKDGFPGADELGAFMRERAVTFAWLPAVAAKSLLGRGDLEALKALAFSGPSCGTVYPGREGLKVVYAYGAPGFPALWRAAGEEPSAPRARPAPGVEALVLDSRGRLVPPGAPGGIRLSGEAVGRPFGERAAASLFFQHPFRRGAPGFMKAPDAGWLDEEGCVNVLGAEAAGPLPALRGRAFSPEAVERRIFASSFLKTMRAGLWGGGGPGEIALWLMASFRDEDEQEKSRQLERLRRSFASSLPAWLIPTRLAFVSRIPLENGLAAAGALPEPESSPLPPDRALEGDPLFLETAEALSSAWRSLMETAPPDGGSFASAGLDGDLAYLLAKNLRARGFPADAPDFRAFPTPEALAAEISRRVRAEFGGPGAEWTAEGADAATGRLDGAYEDLGEISLAGEGGTGGGEAPVEAGREAPVEAGGEAPVDGGEEGGGASDGGGDEAAVSSALAALALSEALAEKTAKDASPEGSPAPSASPDSGGGAGTGSGGGASAEPAGGEYLPEDLTGIVSLADGNDGDGGIIDISRVSPADESQDLPPDVAITPLDEPPDVVAFEFGGALPDGAGGGGAEPGGGPPQKPGADVDGPARDSAADAAPARKKASADLPEGIARSLFDVFDSIATSFSSVSGQGERNAAPSSGKSAEGRNAEREDGGDAPGSAEAVPKTSETPASEIAASETPASETPASETPASETPASETPASETPASEAPASETPASEAPASEAPASEIAASETPASEIAASETPASEIAASETPASETPVSVASPAEPSASETSDVFDQKVSSRPEEYGLKASDASGVCAASEASESPDVAEVSEAGGTAAPDAQGTIPDAPADIPDASFGAADGSETSGGVASLADGQNVSETADDASLAAESVPEASGAVSPEADAPGTGASELAAPAPETSGTEAAGSEEAMRHAEAHASGDGAVPLGGAVREGPEEGLEREKARALSALAEYVDPSKVEFLVPLAPFQKALAAQAATQAGLLGQVGMRSWTLEAPLSPDALEAAFRGIVKETPRLRSVFTPGPGMMRAVLKVMPRSFSASDLKPLGKGASEAASEAALQVALSLWGGAGAPALHRGPLLRLMCFRLEEGVYRLTLVYALAALSPPEATRLLEAVALRAASGSGAFEPFPDPPLPAAGTPNEDPRKASHPALSGLEGLASPKPPKSPESFGFVGNWAVLRKSIASWKGSPFPLKNLDPEGGSESPLLEVDLDLDGKAEQQLMRGAARHGVGAKAFVAAAWLMFLSLYFD